jgi:hypothetical protein
MRVIRPLGGRGGLEELNTRVESRGGRLYGEVSLQRVPFSSRRYNYMLETSRYYAAGYVAAFGVNSPVWLIQVATYGYRELAYNLVSPKFLNRYVNRLASNMEGVNITGISLRDLGDVLHSDKRRTEVINRNEAQAIVTAQLAALSAQNRIMTTGGNDYSFAYSNELIGVPLKHNPFFIIDEEIPFYQMVVSGHMPYAGAPMNIGGSSNFNTEALRLIEYGASPRFTVSWESANLFMNTGLMLIYSTEFNNWRGVITDTYNKVNSALKLVNGSPIYEHRILSPGVRQIEYNCGAVITINYNNEPAYADGFMIAPMDFLFRTGAGE